MALGMLTTALGKGKEQNDKECAKLVLEASFNDYKITHILGLRSLSPS